MDTTVGREMDVNDTRLWVEAAGTGPAVVLIHAGIADARMWDDQWTTLAQRYRVVRYDLRGFGRSPRSAGPFAHHEDVCGVLDALGITSATIVGASMGGEVALAFAVDHPDRVDALVLVNTLAGRATPSEALRAGWQAMETAIEAGDFDQAVETELAMWVDGPRRAPGDADPAVRERVREMDRPLLEAAAVGPEPEEIAPETPVRERLGEITCPVLVIVGALDMPDALASAESLMERLPHAERVEIAGAAHLPSMEQPAAFARELFAFVDGLPRAHRDASEG